MLSCCKTMGVTPKGRKPGHGTASIVCLVMDCTAVTTVGWYGDRGLVSEKMERLENPRIDFRTGFLTISGRTRPA